MNMRVSESPYGLLEQPSAFSIFKRIANLALVVIACLICVKLWLLSTEQANNWHAKQASQLGRSLAQYGAKVLAPVVKSNQPEQIAQQLALLAQDPHVVSVTIFDFQGRVMDSTKTNTSVLAAFVLEDNMPIVFVEEIREDDQILGYLRLLLDEQKVMLYHDDYQAHWYEQLLVLMLLSALLGLLLCRAFYKFQYRHWVKPKR